MGAALLLLQAVLHHVWQEAEEEVVWEGAVPGVEYCQRVGIVVEQADTLSIFAMAWWPGLESIPVGMSSKQSIRPNDAFKASAPSQSCSIPPCGE